MLWSRPDGTPLRGLPVLRHVMPLLMPARAEAIVMFEQELELTGTLRFLAAEEAAGRPCSLFQIVLCALARTLHERPALHRFVAGRRLWQRTRCELSFAVKKSMEERAPITTVKVAFEPGDDLARVGERVRAAIGEGRGARDTASEQEMKLVALLPRFVLAQLFALHRALDRWNLIPAAMIRPDPLYASAFLANLGSLGIDAAYHHLFEYGTIPLFATLGRVRRVHELQADGSVRARDVVTLRYTYDERIGDGFTAAMGLRRFAELVEDPAQLVGPQPLIGAGQSAQPG